MSATAKLVYLALSSRAGETGSSWPSHATLARESSCSVSSAKRALRELRAIGVVTWSERTRDDSGQTSNLYQIRTNRPVDNRTDPLGHTDLPPVHDLGGVGHTDLPPRSHRPTNESQVNEIKAMTDSSSSAQVVKPVDNFSPGEGAPSPSPATVFGIHGTTPKAIRWAEVLADVDRFFSGLHADDLAATGAEILRVSTSPVIDPTRYITKALQNDPLVWQKWAFENMVDEYRADRMRGEWS